MTMVGPPLWATTRLQLVVPMMFGLSVIEWRGGVLRRNAHYKQDAGPAESAPERCEECTAFVEQRHAVSELRRWQESG